MVLVFSSAGYSSIHIVPIDYPLIQDAINISELNDTVLVHPGTYHENLTIGPNAITLASLFILNGDTSSISATNLSPQAGPGAGGRVILIQNYLFDTVNVVGLTISDGEVGFNEFGGGLCANSVSICLLSNRFIENEAERGGGVALLSCTGRIENNHFTENSANQFGGGLYLENGEYIIENNHFTGNNSLDISTGGAGIAAWHASGSLLNNFLSENQAYWNGGGFFVVFGEYWVVDGNHFISNSSGSGGGLYAMGSTGHLTVTNNVFKNNVVLWDQIQSGSGGGAQIGDEIGTLEFHHNIFDSNESARGSGAVVFHGNYTFHHNVFMNNRAVVDPAVVARYTNTPDIEVVGHQNLFFNNDPVFPDCSSVTGAVCAFLETKLRLYQNDFYNNSVFAAGLTENPNYRGELVVENNYWGDASGPFHEILNPNGTGDTVEVLVDSLLPFSNEPFTDWRPPGDFSLGAPNEGEEYGETPTLFTWDTAVDPDNDIVTYELEISAYPTFPAPMIHTAAQDTFIEITCPQNWEVCYWRVRAYDEIRLWNLSNETRMMFPVSVTEQEFSGVPDDWCIASIYPNPFNSGVHAIIGIPDSAHLKLQIFDILGREVAKLHDGKAIAGYRHFAWYPKNSSGIYFLKTTSLEGWSSATKLLYMK